MNSQDRICALEGCGKPLTHTDLRKHYCDSRCSSEAKRRRVKVSHGGECGRPDCGRPIPKNRSRYCSVEHAREAQLDQARRAAKRNRNHTKSTKPGKPAAKKKVNRQIKETRSIKSMQWVPAERWGEYDFS